MREVPCAPLSLPVHCGLIAHPPAGLGRDRALSDHPPQSRHGSDDTDTPATGSGRTPVLWPGVNRNVWVSGDGEIEELDNATALSRAERDPPLVCHLQAARRRLDRMDLAGFDVLELFAFVHPARFILPTPRGLAEFLHLPVPRDRVEEALLLPRAVETLLGDLEHDADATAEAIARAMHLSGWPWSPSVLEVMGVDPETVSGFPDEHRVWSRLQAWSDTAPDRRAEDRPVGGDEARARLGELLGPGAELRPGQVDLAVAATTAFLPPGSDEGPHAVLAEAGTGVGKTLGYVAPAGLWAERNAATVWLSTYTRNLQQQIDRELDRMYPDPVGKARNVVVRKGQENYLCLLALEETTRNFARVPGSGTALGLMARWTLATRDGDMSGDDFPSWLADLLGHRDTLGLAVRRGECLHALCPHYNRCFVEKSRRQAHRARLVIANHALVLRQAAVSDSSRIPTRYVFDEGHHLFDAADSAFATRLTGREALYLRVWFAGGETRRGGSGVVRRIERLVAQLPGVAERVRGPLKRVIDQVQTLPNTGWLGRLEAGTPAGAAETFLGLAYRQVLVANGGRPSRYSIECLPDRSIDDLVQAARSLEETVHELTAALRALVAELRGGTEEEVRNLETASIIRMLEQRCVDVLEPWIGMLGAVQSDPADDFIDRFEITCSGGHMFDVGMHRHWTDPTLPFSRTVLAHTDGAIVTSASLRDASGDEEEDWQVAEQRTGLAHLPGGVHRCAFISPFDYGARTRVVVVNDIDRHDTAAVAAAFRHLFTAANGGALGLFTAIARLREVHRRIVGPLDRAGLQLLGQHVDGMDVSTLVRIFRAETNSCLLGTDAVRDGVDVPGLSLRLLVMERVPWQVPGIVHRARREAFGGWRYDDMLVRLKLRQAFGRLMRRADDTGVFVMLDPRFPGRFKTAFPEQTPGHPLRPCRGGATRPRLPAGPRPVLTRSASGPRHPGAACPSRTSTDPISPKSPIRRSPGRTGTRPVQVPVDTTSPAAR